MAIPANMQILPNKDVQLEGILLHVSSITRNRNEKKFFMRVVHFLNDESNDMHETSFEITGADYDDILEEMMFGPVTKMIHVVVVARMQGITNESWQAKSIKVEEFGR